MTNLKEQFFENAKQFIDAGYMKEIYHNQFLAIFNFGNTLYLACPYTKLKNTYFGLIVGAKQVEPMLEDNKSIIRLIEQYTKDKSIDRCVIPLDKQSFYKCPAAINAFKDQFGDTVIDPEMEERVRKKAKTQLQERKEKEAQLQEKKETVAKAANELLMLHKKLVKKFKKLSYIALVFAIIQIICWITTPFRYQFNPYRSAEPFNKSSEKTGVYSTINCDFLTPLKKIEYTEEYNYYLFGNSQTKEFGIVSIKNLYADEWSVVKDAITLKGYCKEPLTLYGQTSTLSYKIKSDLSTLDKEFPNIHEEYLKKAIDHFSRRVFELDSSADFGKVYLYNASPKQEKPVSSLNLFLNFGGMMIAFLLISIAYIKYGFPADRMKQKMQLFE